jgi:hypothetical protein
MDEQQLSAEQHWDDLAERNPGLAQAFAAALGRVLKAPELGIV